MSRQRKWKYLSCDFETTVYKGQTNTEVWASAVVELFTEDVHIFHSISETFDYFKSLRTNLICYYHNLKFDGNFWLSYLMLDLNMKQASENKSGSENGLKFLSDKEMENDTFKYLISDMGQWYTITIKVNGFFIQLRDSLKLLPFSVKEIGRAFKTKHKKLDMTYEGFRYSGCNITEEEKEYIKNDVLVVKEALEIMFQEKHDKMTIGGCCLEEYKKILTEKVFDALFPKLNNEFISKQVYGSETVDAYIRRSYKGGWCYLVKGKEGKQYSKGVTADVNSLYPSMMHSESGNKFPVGEPEFWRGNYIPEEAQADNKYYFVRIRTRFYLKPGYLPFIQIKGSFFYNPNECLESSDIVIEDKKKRERYQSAYYLDFDGNRCSTAVTLTLTMTDYQLLKEHYELVEFTILDGCYFNAQSGIFDEYIDKYKKLKLESTGALRTLAKLFLNNLYGKMASSEQSSFKVAYLKEDKTIGFWIVDAYEKEAGYIPVGSAITSYARNFTIKAAQKNFHGVNEKGFIYADTDSIHCDLEPEEIKGIRIHDKDFCCWKLESTWDLGLFVRQKTYIEHVIEENLGPIEEPFYNVKCAGMPETCKKLFLLSVKGYDAEKDGDYDGEKLEFLKKKRKISDFKIGLKIPGKLHPKRIIGGVLLEETTYELR